MKKYDYVIAKSYESLFENFERFLHDAMFAQSQRNDSNKLFRVANYNYDDI